MEKSIRFLCLSLLAAVASVSILVADELHFKGDYFLYSPEKNYIFGAGNLIMTGKTVSISGDILYLDVQSLQGVFYGGLLVKDEAAEKRCDALFFTAFPLQLLYETFADKIAKEGGADLTNIIEKLAPEILKKTDLFFEFREFRIDRYKRIKAQKIIPYVMGLPTVPMKSFTLSKGETPDKTTLFFKNLNYSDMDGLSVSFISRLREKFIKGDFDLKFYEKELLKLEGAKRGVLVSGGSDFLLKNSELLNFSVLLNSGDGSYNLGFSRRKSLKYFDYSLSQSISGRQDAPAFYQFASDLTVKKLKFLAPTFNFSHNLRKSYSYGISTPLTLWNRLGLNMRWIRNILKDDFVSDIADFSTSLTFDSSIISLSSSYNFSKDMLAAVTRKNFSINMKLQPLYFLDKNISIQVSSFYMFSDIPSGADSLVRISPGMNFVIDSAGVLLPAGIKLVPSFTLNHIWDNQEENFSDFNSQFALEKEVGKFKCSLAYALASRYRSKNFWVEGSNMKNMNIDFGLIDPAKYSFSLRFYYNNALALENVIFSGRVNLPFNFVFSSFALYYHDVKRFQTLEIFLEKKILHNAKLQGGYSLALKKFFIQIVSI